MDKSLLFVSGSPHVHHDESVKKIMWSVVIALLPALLVSVFYFGLPVIYLTLVSIGSCLLFEYLIQRFLLKGKSTIGDGSAVITGLLLAFNVPSNLPIWILVVGALIAIGVAKMTFGGLGRNLFNPALVGRVFLLISFPVQMTSWPKPTPIWSCGADVITGPTPLGILKEGLGKGETVSKLMDSMPGYIDMLFGEMGGSFGEVSAIALLIGAIFLLIRKVITWHIPVSFICTALIFASIFYFIDPVHYANPLFHLVTGGMLLGAFFMATDMVTSPTSVWRMIVFGAGCGLLTMLIRMFGAYPEGVSFAILIMNALAPLINKGFKPKVFAK
ncbi:MAG: RnfABCDGE type electron transport complex subunit D [Bacteroidales bacterium]|jgi:electron transport complex protein RnfD|nr:RnfABCDGE type electron transport complex subunit D [Bacteroidales bacterium]